MDEAERNYWLSRGIEPDEVMESLAGTGWDQKPPLELSDEEDD